VIVRTMRFGDGRPPSMPAAVTADDLPAFAPSTPAAPKLLGRSAYWHPFAGTVPRSVMRRILFVAALALGLTAAAPIAASYAAPSHAQAVGTGTLGQFGNPTAHVNANDTPAGLKGSFTISYPDGTSVAGVPACLFVDGTAAYVISRITQSSGARVSQNNWPVGNFLVIGVQDNGEPGTNDKLNFSPGVSAQPACAANMDASPVFTIVAGNYQVSPG